MQKFFHVTLLLWAAYKADCTDVDDDESHNVLPGRSKYIGPEENQCSNDFWCLDVEKKIDTLFSRLFYTEGEILQLDGQWRKAHQAFRPMSNLRRLDLEPQDTDYDHCCPTKLVHMLNTTLTNMDGEEKVLIHLTSRTPPKYQLIPHGSCSDAPGSCSATCHQETQVFFLLVADFSNMLAPFTFDRFALPTYCSCKSS